MEIKKINFKGPHFHQNFGAILLFCQKSSIVNYSFIDSVSKEQIVFCFQKTEKKLKDVKTCEDFMKNMNEQELVHVEPGRWAMNMK